jgi:hypothetical protein
LRQLLPSSEFVKFGGIFHLQFWAGKTYVMNFDVVISAGSLCLELNYQILIKTGRIQAGIRRQIATAPVIIQNLSILGVFFTYSFVVVNSLIFLLVTIAGN